MPMQWNEQADARLFANVLKLHVVKIDYAALAKSMGENVTPKAISHRISKIKEKATARRHADWEQHYNQSNKNSNDGVTSTGKKRGPKPKTYRSPRDDEDNRRKRVKAEHVAVVKAEPGIEEEEGAAIEKSREEHVAWSGMGWGPEQQELAQVPGAGERFYEYQNDEKVVSDVANEVCAGLNHEDVDNEGCDDHEENQQVGPEAAVVDSSACSTVSITSIASTPCGDDHDGIVGMHVYEDSVGTPTEVQSKM
ncbi:hypothetical protein P167DRAFT_571336 [Morchella conica CCBAS932]|uniref:Uncharacterized protein n=1 Tax=Morchella conica CCBAS932 TaxID=1392247 RepID=A0A3N4L201_9PEZI|nr:hypothetical protein P167DRAFT_571336 [Morchella conica CCBAS932]